GAQCLEDWLEGWAFATTGFVMGAVVERGVADAYRDHFRNMCENYPKAWWIACQAEWEFRFEFVTEELRRQRDFHAASPGLSGFNPDMPFNSVLLAGTRGLEAVQFWEDRLKEKARNWQTTAHARSHPSWIHRQAALYSPANGGGGSHGHRAGSAPRAPVDNPQVGAGLGRRALKRKLRESAAQRPPPHAERSERWATWVNEKHPDGRWRRLEDGSDFCFAYGRQAGGCSTICSSVPQRSHACEWCRGQHRTIDCPTRPGWQPPPKGKGKGKAKGSHK
ncbi:MAG: hypothetical protein QF599_04785, partial [Planctomycetota bacterium]|nr:hypothetical protein [Planctomycetota bacterium]